MINDIAYNRISVKQGIDRITETTIHFVDGTQETFDVLIGATGYIIDLSFISSDIVPVKEGAIDLYKRIVPPDWPGLYFIGFIQPNTGLPRAFESQCRWLVDYVSGRASLPTAKEMWADIAAKNAWVENAFHDSPRHRLEEEFTLYAAELRRDARQGKQRPKYQLRNVSDTTQEAAE